MRRRLPSPAAALLLPVAACQPVKLDESGLFQDTFPDGETADTAPLPETGESGETGETDRPPIERIPEMYVSFGYPGADEATALQLALVVLNGVEDPPGTWTVDVHGVEWKIFLENSAENLARGLTTPGAVVVYSGHANYGLGPYFDDSPVGTALPQVDDLDDFFNMGTDLVALNEDYLLHDQIYPHFQVDPERVEVSPQNYFIEGLEEERFPNDQGVGPGQGFTLHEQDGYTIHYTEGGGYRLVVRAGAADLPQDLAYHTVFMKACHSGRYFWEILDRGSFFYTRDNVATENTTAVTVDLFVKGTLLGWTEDQIVEEMNAREDIYAWADREVTR